MEKSEGERKRGDISRILSPIEVGEWWIWGFWRGLNPPKMVPNHERKVILLTHIDPLEGEYKRGSSEGSIMVFPCPCYIDINTSFGGFEGCWIHLEWSQFMRGRSLVGPISTNYEEKWRERSIRGSNNVVSMSILYRHKHYIWGFWRVLNPSGVVPIHDSYIAPWSWYPLILIVHVVDRHWNSSKSVPTCTFHESKHSIRRFERVLNSSRVVPNHVSYIALCSMYLLILLIHRVDRHWNCSKSVRSCPFDGGKHWILGF